MEADFWHQRWECGQTAWHQPDVHPTLAERWHEIGASDGSAVFVPLCGRTVDMTWLADRGHRVVGCELSELAVREFFAAVGLTPSTRRVGEARVFEAGPYQLWCGDFFELPTGALAEVVAVYDRASLVAMPFDMRVVYAECLTALTPVGCAAFVLTFVYDPSEMDGPPFSVPSTEVGALFEDGFDVEFVAEEGVLERNPDLGARGLTALTEELHVLTRRS